MSNEDQHLNENEKSTLNEERESEATTDEVPVTREEFENLKKGIQKMATDKGREEAETVENVQEQPTQESSFNSNEIIYLNQRPEAKEVWGDVKQRAEQVGVDPIQFYESDNIIQDYAKRKFDEAQKESESKNKITGPSSFKGNGKKVDFSKVTDDNFKDLSDEQQEAFIQEQIKKEKMGN